MHIQHLNGISPLAERYDVFLLDQFGVLHDGRRAYPGAVHALSALKRAGKTIILVSNSGKRAAPNEARLLKLGFDAGSWDHFVSSGEVAWRSFADMITAGRLRPGTKCLLISRDADCSAVESLPLTLTDSGGDAELVLISGSEGDRYDLDHYRALLAPAAARGIACFCTNPDKVMLTAVGPRFGAGELANLYEKLGGAVIRIGKPNAEIFETSLEFAGRPDRARVVCVGDSLEHDIVGGRRVGLATTLVLSGILKSTADLTALFQRMGVFPDYTIDTFCWG
ncbi:HAD-superfamily class IIA hydrolase, TIGR01459 [Bradyrhizobium sp. Ghvi]|uniref:TIGR01459 family HAD-type hydrolase n=1 Tax=Bradyrhizobium sp. Ghvi TaxID=1855319 RepID=UPI0008EE49F8|nr:TIGR01459 family HAD-type hydrolase [Bradyrhizobium sp. Ghvi]SFQ26900.1 HAD-superfamily class IIA hydrolase, TIGR01459 [Bradyrhizobium sp. Ghvi]